MRKKMSFMFFFFFFISIFIIGSGFSIFYFGNNNTNNSQLIDVELKDNIELGTLKIDDNELETQLFFDNDSVYFIRSDNISKKRNFKLKYEKSNYMENNALIKVAIKCDITIEDTDFRGILIDDVLDNEKYLYSQSIIDYFEPSSIWFNGDSEAVSFKLIDGDSQSKSVTYSSTIIDDINKIETNDIEEFEINLIYSNYTISDSTDSIFGNTMSPNNICSSLNGYKKVMKKIEEAKTNSKITISFRLMINGD